MVLRLIGHVQAGREATPDLAFKRTLRPMRFMIRIVSLTFLMRHSSGSFAKV